MKRFSFIIAAAILILGGAIYLGVRSEKSIERLSSETKLKQSEERRAAEEARRELEREMKKMAQVDNDEAVVAQRRRSAEALNKYTAVQQGAASFDAKNPKKFLDFCLQKETMSNRASCLEGALKRHPSNARMLFRLGETYCTLGERDRAIAAHTRLKRLDPILADDLARTISGM